MTVNLKTHVLSSGKLIYVYDGLLPAVLRNRIFDFVRKSAYFIGWPDADHEVAARHQCLYTAYNDQNNQDAGLLPFLKTTEVNDHIKDLKVTRSVVNLSVPSHTHFVHTHPEQLVALYYVNLEWEHSWHGETLFYSEDMNDIDLALPYTPGRLVLFDGRTPHSIRPQSQIADHYRFTYAITFN
jgi:hypothetical protein